MHRSYAEAEGLPPFLYKKHILSVPHVFLINSVLQRHNMVCWPQLSFFSSRGTKQEVNNYLSHVDSDTEVRTNV